MRDSIEISCQIMSGTKGRIMIDFVDKNKKNATWLLQSRKEFDIFIEKQFGDIYKTDKRTPMRWAIKDIRSAVNNYLNERVGDDVVRNSLSRQSKMYDILENLASHAQWAWKSKLKDALNHPLTKWIAWWTVATAAGATLLD